MKFKNFIKENYKFLLTILLIILVFYLKLPYYIMAPGGSINITDRVVMDDYSNTTGSLNMLYVSEYEMTPAYFLLAKIRNWDIEKNDTRQVSDESLDEIKKRNTIMRDNSLDIATMVAYTAAGKEINISSQKNVVIATTNDNNFEVGDVILKADGISCSNVDEIKKIINAKEVGEYISFDIIRDDKEMTIKSKITKENDSKIIGVVIITEYEYELNPKVDIKFKSTESGSSGGLMLTLTIYNAISDEDIIKGRDIAGTGTISFDGTVGEIDGVKYKIMGAAEDNMDIVFVPEANYKEAIETKEKYDYDMDIVKVDTFSEALEYLRNN